MNLPPSFYYRHYEQTSSTMELLRTPELSQRPERFVVVSADFQTAGRGQRGTHWESAPKANLLCGLSVRPTFLSVGSQFQLSEAFSLAVVEALGSIGVVAEVKWPNDIYIADRKVCGMLLEHDVCGKSIGRTLIGPGINVNQKEFVGDAPNPVSLFQHLGHAVDRERLLESVLLAFERYYDMLEQGDAAYIYKEYFANLYRRTGFHPYEDAVGSFLARVERVEPDGRLVLADEGGRLRTYNFKEVHFQVGQF